MKKIETYIKEDNISSINVVNNAVESLRVNNKTMTTIRYYEDGLIGVAGEIGDVNINELVSKAKANLDVNIKYPYTKSPEEDIFIDNRVDFINKTDVNYKTQK